MSTSLTLMSHSLEAFSSSTACGHIFCTRVQSLQKLVKN